MQRKVTYTRKKAGDGLKLSNNPATQQPVATGALPKEELEKQEPKKPAVRKATPAAQLLAATRDKVEASWKQDENITTADCGLFANKKIKMGKRQKAKYKALAAESTNISDVQQAENFELSVESPEESKKTITPKERRAAGVKNTRFNAVVEKVTYNIGTPPTLQIEQVIGEHVPLNTTSQNSQSAVKRRNN